MQPQSNRRLTTEEEQLAVALATRAAGSGQVSQQHDRNIPYGNNTSSLKPSLMPNPSAANGPFAPHLTNNNNMNNENILTRAAHMMSEGAGMSELGRVFAAAGRSDLMPFLAPRPNTVPSTGDELHPNPQIRHLQQVVAIQQQHQQRMAMSKANINTNATRHPVDQQNQASEQMAGGSAAPAAAASTIPTPLQSLPHFSADDSTVPTLNKESKNPLLIIPPIGAPLPSMENLKLVDISNGELHPHDVLCGRGGGTNHHPGNERFRDLVQASKVLYLHSSKRDKPFVSRGIVRAVRNQDPPGRFLQKDEDTALWCDIGDQKAREKTSQALREGAPEIRRVVTSRLTSAEPNFPNTAAAAAAVAVAAEVNPADGDDTSGTAATNPAAPPSFAGHQVSQHQYRAAAQYQAVQYKVAQYHAAQYQAAQQQQQHGGVNPTPSSGTLGPFSPMQQHPFGFPPSSAHQAAHHAAATAAAQQAASVGHRPNSAATAPVPNAQLEQIRAQQHAYLMVAQHARATAAGGSPFLGAPGTDLRMPQGGQQLSTASSASAHLVGVAQQIRPLQSTGLGSLKNGALGASLVEKDVAKKPSSGRGLGAEGLLRLSKQSMRKGANGAKVTATTTATPAATVTTAIAAPGMEQPINNKKIARDITRPSALTHNCARRLVLAESVAQKTATGAISDTIVNEEYRIGLYMDAGLLGIDPSEIARALAQGRTESEIVEEKYMELLVSKKRKREDILPSCRRIPPTEGALAALGALTKEGIQEALEAIGVAPATAKA